MIKSPTNFSGRYRIEKSLGRGGMAEVYQAFDLRLERYVAIKVIRAGLTDESFLKRFEREAKALGQMDHPNIVKVLDYGDEAGVPYLVMVYLPGGTLKERLGKPIPYQQAARLLAPIAQALDYAHQMKIIHRDVKPSNILMTAAGIPMLTDFGIAKLMEADTSSHLTSTGMGIGTPEYMAPEQWLGNVVPQTDIYALGIVFYEMVTGVRPYTAETPAAILLKLNNDPLPRPRQFVPQLPESVENTLFKALAKRPQDRFANMNQFAIVLDNLAHGITPEIEVSYPDTQFYFTAKPTSREQASAEQAAKALAHSAEKLLEQGNSESALDLYRQASAIIPADNPLHTAIQAAIRQIKGEQSEKTGEGTVLRTPTPPPPAKASPSAAQPSPAAVAAPSSIPPAAPAAAPSIGGAKKWGWLWAIAGLAVVGFLVSGVIAVIGISSLLRSPDSTPTEEKRKTGTEVAEVQPSRTPPAEPTPAATRTPLFTATAAYSPTVASSPTPTITQTTVPPPRPSSPAVAKPITAVKNTQCGEDDILKSIETVDDHTVKFSLCQVDPMFLAKLALPLFTFQPSEYAAKTKGKGEYLSAPIGTGPYYVANWSRSSSLTLKPFPGYWGKAARSPITFGWNNDTSTRLSLLINGKADLVTSMFTYDIPTIQSDPNLAIIRQPMNNTVFIGINAGIKPFSDMRVRQALAMGINRQRMVDELLPPNSELANYLMPCFVPHGCESKPWYEFDPERAKALLAEAGYPNGFSMTIYLRPGYRWYLPDSEKTATLLQEELKQNLNITADIQFMQNAEYREAILNKTMNGIFIMSWYSIMVHPLDMAGIFTYTTFQDFPGMYPDLYQLSLQTYQEPFSTGIYSQIGNLALEQVPYIPLAHTSFFHAARAEFGDLIVNSSGMFQLSSLDQGNDPIRVIDATEPEVLTCRYSNYFIFCAQVLEGLLTYDQDNQLIPWLAEEWSASDDGLTWTFRLRRDVIFQDGSRFDAADVISSFSAMLDVTGPYYEGVDDSEAASYFGSFND